MAVGPKEDPAAFWNYIHLKPQNRRLRQFCVGFVLVLCRFVGFSGAFHKKSGACGGLWGCNCSSACVLRRIISLGVIAQCDLKPRPVRLMHRKAQIESKSNQFLEPPGHSRTSGLVLLIDRGVG